MYTRLVVVTVQNGTMTVSFLHTPSRTRSPRPHTCRPVREGFFQTNKYVAYAVTSVNRKPDTHC